MTAIKRKRTTKIIMKTTTPLEEEDDEIAQSVVVFLHRLPMQHLQLEGHK
jgi:hypothetical protein